VTVENEIMRDILAYLVDHPEAQDTLEGITEWWLLEQKIKYQTKIVQEALEELVKSGLILTHKSWNSRTHYHINQRKYEEIQELLKGGPNEMERPE
jgi:hypothetical protein